MNICSIDIETLSSAPNAAIIQIGACVGDSETGLFVPANFIANVSFDSVFGQKADVWGFNFDVNPHTVKWWMQQNDYARQSLFSNPKPKHIEEVLREVAVFYRTHNCKELWSHATFDAPVLNNAFARLDMETPWSFRDCRDIRTLIALARRNGIQWTKDETRNTHNALDDAKYQLSYILDLQAQLSEQVRV